MDAQPPSVTLTSVADAVAMPIADLALLSASTGIQAALTRAAGVVGLALAIATPALPVTCWQKETSAIVEFFLIVGEMPASVWRKRQQISFIGIQNYR